MYQAHVHVCQYMAIMAQMNYFGTVARGTVHVHSLIPRLSLPRTRVLGGEPGNRANMYMHVVTTAVAAVALKMRPKLMKANTAVGYMYMYQAV